MNSDLKKCDLNQFKWIVHPKIQFYFTQPFVFSICFYVPKEKIKVAFFEESSSFTFPYTTVHRGCVRILTDESESQAVYLHN